MFSWNQTAVSLLPLLCRFYPPHLSDVCSFLTKYITHVCVIYSLKMHRFSSFYSYVIQQTNKYTKVGIKIIKYMWNITSWSLKLLVGDAGAWPRSRSVLEAAVRLSTWIGRLLWALSPRCRALFSDSSIGATGGFFSLLSDTSETFLSLLAFPSSLLLCVRADKWKGKQWDGKQRERQVPKRRAQEKHLVNAALMR